MRSSLAIISFLTLLFAIVSCGSKAFPDERFTFSSKYRDLINPYHPGDTLYFTNEKLGTQRILITGIDSFITNRKGGFMNQKPYKIIQVYCDALDYHRPTATDSTLVFINIYPDNLEQTAHFSMMNFRGSIEENKDSLVHETQPAAATFLSDCFVIRNVAADIKRGEDDIEYIYVQKTEGILAFKSYRGDWWLRQ